MTFDSGFSIRETANRFAGLMLNAIQKRAWGESWCIYFDPTAFVEYVEPAIGDALEAMDDRDEMASVLIDLYRGHGEPGTLARVLEATVWTGSGALYAAVQKTVSQSGRKAIALIEEALSDEEEEAVGYLFDGRRAAVRAIRDPAERLGVLHDACEGVLKVTRENRDRAPAESLRRAMRFAGEQDDPGACETLLEGLCEALAEATDPWSVLGAFLESSACRRSARCNGVPDQLLWTNLRAAIASEGSENLWEAHTYFKDEWKSDDLELGMALHDTCLSTVRAVRDPRWFADRVLGICDEIAHASDDHSCWLPDRVQVARACAHTIATVAGVAVANAVLVQGLADAVDNPDEPLAALLEATRELLTTTVDASEAVGVLVGGLPLPSLV